MKEVDVHHRPIGSMPAIPAMPETFPSRFIGRARIEAIRKLAGVSNREIAAEFGGEHYIITGLANGWTQLTHQTAEIVWGFLLRSCWERRCEMHYQNLVNMMTGVR